MKRPITRIALVLCVLLTKTLFAQTERGSLLLGGSLSFSTSKSKNGFDTPYETKFSSFSFNPDLAYLVADKLAIGAYVPISISSSRGEDDDYANTTTSLAFGPMVRYYISAGQWAFFPEVSYYFGKSIYKGGVFDPIEGLVKKDTQKSNIQSFRAGFGVTYFLNRSIGLEALLSYNKYKTEADNDYTGINSSLGLTIGFQIYFAKNAE